MKKKKPNIKTIIRQMVREEVAMAIKEVITELKQPIESQPTSQKKIVEKKSFSSNSVLNDVLNETAQDEEWKTMGGGKFDSSKINDVMGGAYGDMMNKNPNIPVSVEGQSPDFLKKDYRAVMKAIDKKQGK